MRGRVGGIMSYTKDLGGDIALAILALVTLVLMPTVILPLVSAAAIETGIGLVAFWVAYAWWAGACLYYSAAGKATDAFISCVIGFIPVL